jgi:LPS-assembly protein
MRCARNPLAASGIRRLLGVLRHCSARTLVTCALILTTLVTSAPVAEAQFKKMKPISGTQKLDEKLPLYLQGDQLIYDTKGNRVIARGNVEIFYDDNQLTADEVVYDQSANTLSAVGNVMLKEKSGNIVRAERYTLTDDFRDGFVQSLSIVTSDESKITACKTDNGMPPLWCISAKKVVHDQAQQKISYEDAQFLLFGQPVAYLPYFEHPDPTVKRRSGFLSPEYRTSTDLGFGFETPYYFALAPNYDFTFHPAYLSKQGILYQGIWRHKLENGQYIVKLSGIDQDADNLPETANNRENLDGFRGSIESKGEFSLSSWWKAGWDGTLESDDTYRRFYKLDNILLTDRVSTAYLVGQSERSYLGASLYHFGGLQFNDTSQAESTVHPIIDHNYVAQNPVLGGELRWNTNAVSFTRTDGDALDRTTDINKVTSELKWRRRFTDQVGITYTPFGELRGDVYQLNNYSIQTDPNDPNSRIDFADETVTRGRTMGGVTVAYPWVASASNGSHVVEPIGQIVTRQNGFSQGDMPDEDAKSLVFDDTNLFEADKFSGFDRLESGTRVNAGLQYTFQANNGGFLRVLAGQSFHVSGQNAFADPGLDADGEFVHSPTSGLESSSSDYVLGIYAAPIDTFRVLSQSRFDERTGELRREDLSVRVNYGPLVAQATYTYSDADPRLGLDTDQQDIVGWLGLQLSDHWSIAGSMRYDIDASQRLLDSIQLRYLDECFMLSATYEETFIVDPLRDINTDRSVMLRFELKNLGGFKYKTDVLDHVFSNDQPPGQGTGGLN